MLTPLRDFLMNTETKILPDKISIDQIFAENVIKFECDMVTRYGYSRLWTHHATPRWILKRKHLLTKLRQMHNCLLCSVGT
jgi:hypothetical protein